MSRPTILVLCISFCVTAAACQDRPPEPAPQSPANEQDLAKAPPEPVPAKPPKPIETTAPRPALEVPEIAVRPPTAEAARQAEELNLQGMAAFNEKDYPTAIGRFVEALEANPAAHQARYNLACALVLSGDGREGLEQLEQLKKGNCRECRAMLDRARFDKDLEILKGHPRFESIVADQLR